MNLFGGTCRVLDHAESCAHIKTWQRFSAFLLGMTQRAGSHGPTSDTSKKSSLKRTERLKKRIGWICFETLCRILGRVCSSYSPSQQSGEPHYASRSCRAVLTEDTREC